jgi:membrane protease subunit HflC
MNQNRILIIVGLLFLGILVIRSSLYTVSETEKAIVVQLGQVVRSDDEPGLHVKIPIIQDVRYFDSRILTLDAEPQRYLTKEKKSVIVDSFVMWRINDTLKYFLTVGGNELQARALLQQWINGGLRDQFGARALHDVVSGERQDIMDRVRESADNAAREQGIEVVDVRLQRVDLPVEVSQSVYQRMEAERTRIAKDLRARGAEVAEKIRAEADRSSQILKAEAYRDAEKTRGQGDSKAIATYGKAFKKNPEFYRFYRSLNAYKESFKTKNDIMIVDPSAEFFKYLKKSGAR